MQTLLLALLISAAQPGKEASSPARAVQFAHADCSSLPAEDQPYVRYLWVSSDRKRREDTLVALSFHLNLLSVHSVLKHPTLVAPDLVRIDVRDYGWYLVRNGVLKRNILPVWEKFAGLDPYFHQKAKVLKDVEFKTVWPGGTDKSGKHYDRGRYDQERKAGRTQDIAAIWLPAKEIEGLRLMTYSEAPVLVAEWFFAQTARQVSIRNEQEGVGYYDFLGLKDRQAFFDLTGTDEKKAIERFGEWRAVVEKSGISQQNRQIFKLEAIGGSTWGTLDTFKQKGRGVAIRNLRRGEFVHDAEEWYGFLPNKLYVTFLSDKNGVAQESAPDKIGPDKSALNIGNDGRVHANISCMRCHGVDKDMLKPVDDVVRALFEEGSGLHFTDKSKDVLQELQSQYLRDIDSELTDDRARYTKAIRLATMSRKNPKGLTAAQITKLYCELWNQYVETPLTAADVAREIGVTEDHLVDSLKRHARNRGATDLVLAAFLRKVPLKVTRLNAEDSIPLAAVLCMGAHPLEIEEEKK